MLLFITIFILTFLLVRTGTYIFDHPGTDKSDVHTPTKIVSKLLGVDIHHWHLGILIIIFTTFPSKIFSFNNLHIVSLAIGTSLFLDQAPFLFMNKMECDKIYFTIKGFSIALIAHLIVILIFYYKLFMFT
jgi:hypothetical protein